MDKEKLERIYKSILIVSIAVFITFIVTSTSLYLYYSNNPTSLKTSKNSTDINSGIQRVRDLIDKYYLGSIDEEKLREGAIKGYVEGLGDPYTEYIPKEEMESYMEDTLGNFVGIGIYMAKNVEKDRIQIISTIKGSPAEAAGIQAGDLIIKVDDIEYKASDMNTASNSIKGEEGSSVKLELLRNTETIEYEVTREKIKVNQVEGRVISNNIGYIGFTSFDETTAEDFKTKFEELNSQGIKSLIIDIRNNGGGIVNQAIQIADYIADKDSVLLYEVDKNDKEEVKTSQNDPIINMPIVILTNNHSASASEILAGALKDLGKAKIVGTKTYGKGVIQQIISLSDGSGFKVTIEEYQTPNRKKINKIGIEPDVTVELPEDAVKKIIIKDEEDTQLQKAIEMLK